MTYTLLNPIEVTKRGACGKGEHAIFCAHIECVLDMQQKSYESWNCYGAIIPIVCM